jgi:hypothetical protein
MAKGGDPYAGIVSGTADLEPNAALARGQTLYFTAVYMLAFLTLSSQGAGRSHDWRAGWVYFAAPIRRYDDFCLGVMWGVVYGLLLPAVVAIVLVILLAWRDPLHVAAHVAPPAALALLAVPCALLLDPAPPFSREPLRNLRGRDLALWFIVAFPMFAIGTAHYELRHRPAALVGAGVALALLAMLVWALVARRLRNAFPRNTFEA